MRHGYLIIVHPALCPCYSLNSNGELEHIKLFKKFGLVGAQQSQPLTDWPECSAYKLEHIITAAHRSASGHPSSRAHKHSGSFCVEQEALRERERERESWSREQNFYVNNHEQGTQQGTVHQFPFLGQRQVFLLG
ncbi:hypothetical protein GOP47_0011011 [Adiantum capillus-veneris]|uniref:Uncharacterized protein n=1 Tax=Adiantum capillus-veneris TaxID=13818 RepID=A0A9D4UWE8_ADICA|nr:hypothetical protein GOP47_0011011 [Adiantum capillus-veneris]